MFAQRTPANVTLLNTLLPYNGENGFMPCIQKDHEDQLSRPSAKDNNNRASRPTSLGPVTTSSSGFSSRSPGSAQGGGSQASSPESSLDLNSDSLPESEISATNAQLENDTRNLLTAFFHGYSDLKHPRCSKSKALATMDRVVKELVIKHEIAYKGMLKRLNVDDKGDDLSFMSAVAKETFSDGITNWGRIASLLAFSAELCRHLKNSGKEHCVDQVASLISSYLLSDQLEFLINNKEWDGFVEFFHSADPESAVMGALVRIVGVAGIGAGLAFLLR